MRASSTAATESADNSYRIVLSPRPPVHIDDRHRSSSSRSPVRFGAGLVINQLCVGVVHGALPALVYPLVKQRLLLQGYQANSSHALLAVAVTCKLGFSVLMDRLPLPRWSQQRRAPFIYTGWLLVLLFTIVLARLHASTGDDAGDDDNEKLTGLGSKTVLLLVGVALGSVLADAGCEAVMVDATRHESSLGESEECVTAGASRADHKTMYAVRFTAEVLGALLVGLGLNDAAFGGSFPSALPVSVLFEVLLAVALIAILATMWSVKEDVKSSGGVATITPRAVTEKVSPSIAVPDRHATAAMGSVTAVPSRPSVVELGGLRRVLRSRVTWQLALFGFLQKLFLELQAAPRLAIHASWLHTDPLWTSIALAVTSGAYALASLLSHRVLLTAESNWRSITLFAVVIGSGLSLLAGVVTAMDIIRDKYLVLIVEQTMVFCDAIAMMVRMLAVVNIAEPGRESSTYAVVTGFYTLAEPVSAAISNYLGAAFDVFDADIAGDSERVRWHVVGLFITLGALRVVGNASILPLLPRDQRAAHELKQRWHVEEEAGHYSGVHWTRVAVAVAAVTVAVSITALAINVLAIVAPTACLPFAGGEGC